MGMLARGVYNPCSREHGVLVEVLLKVVVKLDWTCWRTRRIGKRARRPPWHYAREHMTDVHFTLAKASSILTSYVMISVLGTILSRLRHLNPSAADIGILCEYMATSPGMSWD